MKMDNLLKCKKAQEDATIVWIATTFIIIFILVVYFFFAFSMTEIKSLSSREDFKENEAYYTQDISSSENFFSILNSEINFNGKKEKVISAILESFDSYFETKDTEGRNLVEKYGLNNYNDISRTTRDKKIKDGFNANELDKIDSQNLELVNEINKTLSKYCSKYRLAIPQGMITEKGRLESSDALGSRIYYVMSWGDNPADFNNKVGFNITYRGSMTDIKFTQLKECSGTIMIGGQN